MYDVKIGAVAEKLNVSVETVRNWTNQGKLHCIVNDAGTRYYDLNRLYEREEKDNKKKRYFYCRVSSKKQEDNLKNQEKLAKEKYPNHEIISDIGSGLNWERHNLRKILKESIEGKVGEIVVFHRDRLCRFGFEIIQFILDKAGVKLLVHEQDIVKTSEQELAEDVIEIMHVFSCSFYGKRRYHKIEEVQD